MGLSFFKMKGEDVARIAVEFIVDCNAYSPYEFDSSIEAQDTLWMDFQYNAEIFEVQTGFKLKEVNQNLFNKLVERWYNYGSFEF